METFFLFALVGIAIAVAVSKHSKALNETWEKAGRRLNLEFSTGNGRSLRGKRPEMGLLVEGKSAGKTQFTDYTATFTKSLSVHLRMKPQGFFSEISRSLLNRVDIEIGDPLFDSGVIIEGDDPDEVREFLNPEIVSAVKKLIARFDSFEVTHRRITTKRNKLVNDADLLIRDIQLLEEVAKAVVENGNADGNAAAHDPPPIPKVKPSDELVSTPQVLFEVEESSDAESEIAGAESEKAVATEDEPKVIPDAVVEIPEETPPQFSSESVVSLEDTEIEEATLSSGVFSPCLVANSWTNDFSEAASHYAFVRIFEDRWKDTEVTGKAILRSVESFWMDRTFGRGPGTRRVFEIGDLKNGDRLTLITDTQAGVSIDALRSRIGQVVAFDGTLIRCDAFESALFLRVPVPEVGETEL